MFLHGNKKKGRGCQKKKSHHCMRACEQKGQIIVIANFHLSFNETSIQYGFCRIDDICGDDAVFDYHGKKYPSRIAIYRNHIGYRQKPDYVYYGQYDYSARNWWYTFYDQDENIRAIFEYRAVVGVGEESGYYFSINEDEKPIICKTFLWLDWLKRHK